MIYYIDKIMTKIKYFMIDAIIFSALAVAALTGMGIMAYAIYVMVQDL